MLDMPCIYLRGQCPLHDTRALEGKTQAKQLRFARKCIEKTAAGLAGIVHSHSRSSMPDVGLSGIVGRPCLMLDSRESLVLDSRES